MPDRFFVNLLVSFLYMTKVSSETVFVKLLMCLAVPEAACIRRNFISKDDLSFVTTKLYLEIDEINLDAS